MGCCRLLAWWLAGLAVLVGWLLRPPYTPALQGRVTGSSMTTPIAELSTIVLNGVEHVMLVRGVDVEAPVLLILHGGPGFSELFAVHQSQYLFEQQFVVVNFDQRSSGRTCSHNVRHHGGVDNRTLTVQQGVDDVIELVRHLLQRFGKEKVYLSGGSWGSMLGLLCVHQHPNLFHYFVARGMFVHGIHNEQLSTEYVVNKLAEYEADHTAVIDSLKALPHPYSTTEELLLQRKWLAYTGGGEYECFMNGPCNRYRQYYNVIKSALTSPEYGFIDLLYMLPCVKGALASMWPELQKWDAEVQVPKIETPFLLIQGRHDHNTPSSLVPQFFKALKAPKKRLVWFEDSSHSPHKERPERFQKLVIDTFLGKSVPEQ